MSDDEKSKPVFEMRADLRDVPLAVRKIAQIIARALDADGAVLIVWQGDQHHACVAHCGHRSVGPSEAASRAVDLLLHYAEQISRDGPGEEIN